MKKYLRIIALIMAFLTLSGILVACAETGDSEVTENSSASTTAPENSNEAGNNAGETTTSAPETLFEEDDLDEKYNFNKTITVYMWSDYTMREFHAEESGDVIDDAIFNRNDNVEERLGITFDFVEVKGNGDNYKKWMQQAENDFQSDNTYDIYAGYSRSAPLMALKNMNANLLEHNSFSVEKSWWPAALTNECTINDQLYYCSGDISTNLLWMMIATFYNKDLYTQYFANEKTPMEMVQDKEWTMDKLFSMTQDIYTDDGNAVRDNLDTYGYVLYDVNIDAFQTAAGIVSIEKDNDDNLIISTGWNSQRCADVCELVGNFLASPGCYHENKTSIRDIFFEERALFITDRVFIVAGKDTSETAKIEFSYGIVPNPMYSADQLNYMTNVGHPFTMYAVNAQSKNLEEAVTTLEAMGSANHRSVTPAVFEVAMKVRYTDDPLAAEMYDILRENISFDLGRIYAETFGNGTANIFRKTANSSNPSSLLSLIKTNERIIKNGIKKIDEYYNN